MLAEGSLTQWLRPRMAGGWLWRAANAAPAPAVAFALRLLVLPAFGPCFIGSWLRSGMLEAVGQMVPHVECGPGPVGAAG